MKKKHYLVYKTTCLLNGKIYIGKHETKNVNDDYLGSGKLLKRAIEKYGRENFKREILFECSSKEEMDAKEAELVNEEFLKRDDVYNITLGGEGGFYHISKDDKSRASKTRWRNMTESQRRHSILHANLASRGRIHSERERKNISDGLKLVYSIDPKKNGMFGKKHSKYARIKMRLSHIGERNSQFGKMWICNDLTHESKKILKTEPIPDGWRKGRFC